jgi:putative oxidoreductase
MQWVIGLYLKFLYMMGVLSPVMMLVLRVWIGHVFWVSGVLKASDWDTTITLFTYEHPVPFLPVSLAAFMGTAFELLCPILLVFGLATRLSTLPLIVMTLVIHYTYLETTEHYYWLMILGVILCKGPDALSVDAWIRKRYGRRYRYV